MRVCVCVCVTGVLGDLWGVTTKLLVHCGVRNKILKANGGVKEKRNVPKRPIRGQQSWRGWGARPPPVFAKFVQNLPFLPQILAFLCLQRPHVPVSHFQIHSAVYAINLSEQLP